MDSNGSQLIVALVLLAATGFLVAAYLKYKASGSERRMMRMLQRAGLDPEFGRQKETEAVMKEIRRRCRNCQAEDVCERWLAGELTGENVFCPNRQVFEELAERARAT